jgi:hypothetical protein
MPDEKKKKKNSFQFSYGTNRRFVFCINSSNSTMKGDADFVYTEYIS